MTFKALISLVSVLLLAGCAVPATEPTDNGKLHIVTSTNVWADIVKTLGGDKISVEPIVSNPNQDPHSYELTPKDKLAISKADLVIAACNSTDSFFLPKDDKQIFDCLGRNTIFDAELDPHVWFDLSDMIYNVLSISNRLAQLDPENAAFYQANYDAFKARASTILSNGHSWIEKFPLHVSKEFIATETIGNYLLVELGFKDVTPNDIRQAGMNETDLSVKQMADLKANLYSKLFSYNKSQQSAQTTDLLNFLADETCNDNPSVNADSTQTQASSLCLQRARPIGFYEQLPSGISYLDWMDQNVREIVSIATDTVID